VNFKAFDELQHLDISCQAVLSRDAALVVLGDRASALAAQLIASGAAVQQISARVLFGLPILTAPFPLFVGGVMTERNTILARSSVFAWIEDNYIEQPRAEVFGLTPFAEQPVLFLRDFDMDRPVEAWFQTARPAHWVRVVGLVIASSRAASDVRLLEGDDAALIAMASALPPDMHALIESLRIEVAQGGRLKVALRKLRKIADANVMRSLDGWRVLAQAAQTAEFNPSPDGDFPIIDALKLASPKRW